MEQRWRLRLGEAALQVSLAGLESRELVLERQAWDAVLDGLNELAKLALDLGQFPFGRRRPRVAFHSQAVHLPGVLVAELLEEILPHQLVADGVEDALLDLAARNRESIGAGPAGAGVEAGELLAPEDDVSATALSALRQTGEQVLRPSESIEFLGPRLRGHVTHGALPRLDSTPEVIVDDPQGWNVRCDPFREGVRSREAFACIRILHVSLAIPYEASDVQFVVQDSGAATRVTVDRAGTPGTTVRTGDAFLVQALGNLLRRDALLVFREDPADNCGLVRDDLPLSLGQLAVLDHSSDAIAVAQASARPARFNTAAQTAPRLFGEILQEQCVHRSFQTDVQVRDFAFGERDDADVLERQTLEQAGGVFLVAAEAIERLGQDSVETLRQRFTHQLLKSWPEQCGA